MHDTLFLTEIKNGVIADEYSYIFTSSFNKRTPMSIYSINQTLDSLY